MNIKIKKLHEKAIIPSYAKEGDCGLDLTAISISTVDKGNYGYIEYDTGLSIEVPEGYVGLVYPRSSISDSGLILTNSVGVIDQNYRGSIRCRFKAIPNTVIYNVGDRVAQIIIQPCPKIEFELVDELSDTTRGDLGFGSTGK